MIYWYSLIKDLDIPMPKTLMLSAPHELFCSLFDGDSSGKESVKAFDFVSNLEQLATAFGYPLFMRTSHTSAKHSWKETCYVKSETELRQNFFRLVEISLNMGIMGLPVDGIVLREYIEMNSLFTAFGGDMPVSPERRYFIRDGRIQCRHAYWVKGAIQEDVERGIEMAKLMKEIGKTSNYRSYPENWEELLEQVNTETKEETKLLSEYANKVARVLDGYWSVDFCQAKDGKWYLIDAALGEESYHPECKFKPKDQTN
jgi:hypothetical protein